MTNWRIAGIAAATLLAVAGPAPTAHGTRKALSGDLTKPLAQYTGDEFFALVRGLNYGSGADRQRRCRGNADCAGGRRTSVRVDAVADADSLSPGNLPQYGVIAALAVNHGADVEDRYGMQPGGRFAYYLIVLPSAGGTARWALEELDVAGNNRAHRTVASGRFNQCNHPYVRGARADFKTCAGAAGLIQASLVSFGSVRQGRDDEPLWIGCASGCCTSDGS